MTKPYRMALTLIVLLALAGDARWLTSSVHASQLVNGMQVPNPKKLMVFVDDFTQYEQAAGFEAMRLVYQVMGYLPFWGIEAELGMAKAPAYARLQVDVDIREGDTYVITVRFVQRLFYEQDGKRHETVGAVWSISDSGSVASGENAGEMNQLSILSHVEVILRFFIRDYLEANGLPKEIEANGLPKEIRSRWGSSRY